MGTSYFTQAELEAHRLVSARHGISTADNVRAIVDLDCALILDLAERIKSERAALKPAPERQGD